MNVDVPIVGDAKKVLAAMLVELKKLGLSSERHVPWMERVAAWKQAHPMTVRQDDEGELMPEYVVRKIWEVTNGEAIICTEVGQNQMWAAQHLSGQAPAPVRHLGRLGHHGFRFPRLDRRQACPAGSLR